MPWPAVRAYAERVIAAIRQHDPLNLIIVGTPYWSQHVDVAAAAPLDDANVSPTVTLTLTLSLTLTRTFANVVTTQTWPARSTRQLAPRPSPLATRPSTTQLSRRREPWP